MNMYIKCKHGGFLQSQSQIALLYGHTHYAPIFPHTGSPYEMGYAHGSLMKDKVKGLMNDVWAYMELQVVSSNTVVF